MRTGSPCLTSRARVDFKKKRSALIAVSALISQRSVCSIGEMPGEGEFRRIEFKSHSSSLRRAESLPCGVMGGLGLRIIGYAQKFNPKRMGFIGAHFGAPCVLA